MTSEPSAIAAIAQQSTLSKKMPYIFVDMIKLYDGTQLPYSTHIISPSLLSNHNCKGIMFCNYWVNSYRIHLDPM